MGCEGVAMGTAPFAPAPAAESLALAPADEPVPVQNIGEGRADCMPNV